jgi:hypothetical protein
MPPQGVDFGLLGQRGANPLSMLAHEGQSTRLGQSAGQLQDNMAVRINVQPTPFDAI